jgi:hypothetical protein
MTPQTGGSGGGGVGGSGGTSGVGGGGGSGGGVAPGDMIDDLEDGDASIIRGGRPPRVGAWYVYHDTTAAGAMTYPAGPFLPVPGGANGTAFAARFAGNGFTTWGAGMGFNLNDAGDGMGGSSKMVYDASAYHGITFYAKANTPMRMRVNFSNHDTDSAGGACTVCEDDFGAYVTLGTDWQSFAIAFADASQVGYGTPVAAFDTKTLYAIHFQVAVMPFDVEVDEIGLTK